MLILGVDPGLHGALAWLYPTGVLHIDDMPTIAIKAKRETIDECALANLIDSRVKDCGSFVAYLELVNAMPTDGKASAGTFMRGYGLLRGILRGHFLTIEDVTPSVWKRRVGIPAGSGKDASRAKAANLFPRQSTLFSRKKDEGRADAALIAWYGFNHQQRALAA